MITSQCARLALGMGDCLNKSPGPAVERVWGKLIHQMLCFRVLLRAYLLPNGRALGHREPSRCLAQALEWVLRATPAFLPDLSRDKELGL